MAEWNGRKQKQRGRTAAGGVGGEDAVRPQRAERSEGAIMIQDFLGKKSELSGIMTTIDCF